jgi:hypothetical protein
MSWAACLTARRGRGYDKGVCTNHGNPFMQTKDCFCTNHVTVLSPVTGFLLGPGEDGECAPHLAWEEVVTVVVKLIISCSLGQCILEPVMLWVQSGWCWHEKNLTAYLAILCSTQTGHCGKGLIRKLISPALVSQPL